MFGFLFNKKLGITGNALEGIAEGPFGKFVKGFGIEKVTEHMREFAEEAVRSGKEVSRLQVLGEGVKAAFKNRGQEIVETSVAQSAKVNIENLQKNVIETDPTTVDA